MTKIEPLGDYVLLQISTKQELSTGGIVLPTAAREHNGVPRVVKVGPGRITEQGNIAPMTVEVGADVLLEPQLRYENYVIEANEQYAYMLVRQHLIIATV